LFVLIVIHRILRLPVGSPYLGMSQATGCKTASVMT